MEKRGQPTRGGLPAWGLGELLTTPHPKNVTCYEPFTKASEIAEGICVCGNEPSSSIKCGEFLD